MASSSQPTLIFMSTEKLKNLIIIDYQCPPDPNHINHVLEMLINITRLYVQSDPTKAQPIQNFISQIAPQLFSLYDQSVNQMLTHTGTPFLHLRQHMYLMLMVPYKSSWMNWSWIIHHQVKG